MSNFEDFVLEYNKDECQNTRCLNRQDALVEVGRELRDERALVKRILEHAKNNLPAEQAFPILQMIAKHNLGENYGKDVRGSSRPVSPFIG